MVVFILVGIIAARFTLNETNQNNLEKSESNSVSLKKPLLVRVDREKSGISSLDQSSLDVADVHAIIPPRGALLDELNLSFDSRASYEESLQQLVNRGFTVISAIPQLRTIRINSKHLNSTQELHLDHTDYTLSYNYSAQLPTLPNDSVEVSNPLQAVGLDAAKGIHMPEVIDAAGAGVKIALIDSGITDHSSLSGADIQTLNVIKNSSSSGHGTAVASLIVSQDPAVKGVAPRAELLNIPVFDQDGNSNTFDVAAAIIAAVDQDVDIINMSLGSYGDSLVLKNAVQYATENGIVIVAASGNDGSSQAVYPAAYKDVVSVAAVDMNANHASFSNSGFHISIAAPGVGVASAWEDNQFVSFSGTSASAPLVSAALATLMSEQPDLSANDAAIIMLANADDVGAIGGDERYGSGTVNVERMLQHNTSGIYDVAITDHFIDIENSNQNTSSMWVNVQNSGTEWLGNMELSIDYQGHNQKYIIYGLNPGESTARQILLNTQTIMTGNEANIQSEVKMLQDLDAIPSNNIRATTIRAGEN